MRVGVGVGVGARGRCDNKGFARRRQRLLEGPYVVIPGFGGGLGRGAGMGVDMGMGMGVGVSMGIGEWVLV